MQTDHTHSMRRNDCREDLVRRLCSLPDDAILSISDVALWLEMKDTWVRDHASGRAQPVLPAMKAGKRYRFRWGTLKEWAHSLHLAQKQKR
jgi:hypothetical protein